MPNRIAAFECCFCNKVYRLKQSAAAHEKKCFANPATKACRSCKNACKDSNTVYVPPHGDQNYGDADYEEVYIYCDCDAVDKILVYPSKPERASGYVRDCPYYEQGEKLF